MDNHNIPDKIVDTVISPELIDTGIDIAEICLDKLLDEDFLKEIPFIKTIFGITKGIISVRDKIFMAKVVTFLVSLKDISKEDREFFSRKISEDAEFKRKVGNDLIQILDRLNDLKKPEILAIIFTYFLKNKIDYDDFRRLGSAVDSAFIDDLAVLSGGDRTGPHDSNYLSNLQHTGLTDLEVGKSWDDVGEIRFKLSSLGQLYVKIMTGTIE
jgi:hypothetical protein